jgi:hypothetical protein
MAAGGQRRHVGLRIAESDGANAMSERWVTFVFACGALLLFLAMFVRSEGNLGARKDVPRPTSAERRGNGYYGAMSWLEAEEVRAVSLRDRFNSLGDRADLPRTGNLLIVTLPSATAFKSEEFLPLDRWIRAGNTLLVVAALSDNPDWAFRFTGVAPGDLNLLTGLEFETVRNRRLRLQHPDALSTAPQENPENFRAFIEPQRSVLVANREHAYFKDVRETVALSDYPRQSWTVKVPYEGFVLSLGHIRDTGEGVFWTRPLGEGRIIVSGFGTLFTNRALGLADNARLLANIVGATVGPQGAVLFDDAHQGLGAAYDPEMFYKDSRLYFTLALLIVLWFAWVVGSTRLRVPVARTPAPREAELVRATGGFLARVLRPDAAALRLLDHLSQHASWDYLERHPRVSRADIDQLRRWQADARAARKVPLRKIQNVLVRIHRQIA